MIARTGSLSVIYSEHLFTKIQDAVSAVLVFYVTLGLPSSSPQPGQRFLHQRRSPADFPEDGPQEVHPAPGWFSELPPSVSAASSALGEEWQWQHKTWWWKKLHTWNFYEGFFKIFIFTIKMYEHKPLCLTLIFSISGIRKLYTISDTISSDWRLSLLHTIYTFS